jgi:HEAT repeat protein
LKATLIIYLGLFRKESHVNLLAGIYSSSAEERVRLAAIAALGNSGGPAREFLRGELELPERPLSIRKACIQALGAAGDLSSASLLIDLLAQPSLRWDAARALRRIAGIDLGESQGAWQRWWKLHQKTAGVETGEDDEEEVGEDEEMTPGG